MKGIINMPTITFNGCIDIKVEFAPSWCQNKCKCDSFIIATREYL